MSVLGQLALSFSKWALPLKHVSVYLCCRVNLMLTHRQHIMMPGQLAQSYFLKQALP